MLSILTRRERGVCVLKSSKIKTNSSFTLVQKRHLAFLFLVPFPYNKPVITKGEENLLLIKEMETEVRQGGVFKAQKQSLTSGGEEGAV